MPASDDDAPTNVSMLAAMLLAAHANGDRATAAPAPADAAEAHAVQRLVAARLGRTIGWKVGRKREDAPPHYAPLVDTRVHASGAAVQRPAARPLLLETELLFTFGADLPPRAEPYRAAEVAARLRDVRPAFELVDSRLAGWPDAPPLAQLADSLSHACMILGEPSPSLPAPAWDRRRLRLEVDGIAHTDGIAANPAGDLLDLMTWLVNALARAEGGLRAGDLVTTGSFTGMTELGRGSVATAAFEGIGAVTVRIE